MYKINYKIEGGLVVQIDEVVAESRALMSSFEDLHDSGLATGYVDTIPNNRVGHTMELHYINKALTASYTPIRGWVELATTTNTVSLLPHVLNTEQQSQVHTNIDTKSMVDMAFINKMLFFTSSLNSSYDSVTKMFTIGDISDLTIDDMLVISEYGMARSLNDPIFVRSYSDYNLYSPRIILPQFAREPVASAALRLKWMTKVEVLYAASHNFVFALSSELGFTTPVLYIFGAAKLAKIVGTIDVLGAKSVVILGCPLLTTFLIKKLSTNATIGSAESKVSISKESLIYMLTQRWNAPNKIITIIVDDIVYAWASIDIDVLALLPTGNYTNKEVGEVQLGTY